MKENFFEFRGGISYEDALRYQGVLNERGYVGLFAFESQETITLGHAGDTTEDILVSPEFLTERGVTVVSTDRGGRATWHGPGQLVGFPLGNLRQIYGDVKAVKRLNDELLMGLAHACAVLGVKSVETRAQQPGLWTSKGKLASVGFTVKDGYIFHGFSLNVRPSCAAGFTLINPCGIANCAITSLEQEGVRVENMRDLALKIFPYLSFYSANKSVQSRIWRHEADFTELVAKVSRSPIALERLQSSVQGNQNL